jgi:DNA (cytosine-5)-methyltransferase 1
MRSGKPGGGKDPLVKEELSLALSTQNTQTVFTGGFKYRNGAKARSIGYADEQAPTLETSQNVAIYNTPIVQCLNDQGGSVMDVSDKAGTLRAQSHGHEPIVHTICGNIIGRENQNGGHQMGVGQDVSYTLNTVDRHAVATGFRASGFQGYEQDNVAGTLRAQGGTLGGAVKRS